MVEHGREERPGEPYDGLAAALTRRFGRTCITLFRRVRGRRAAAGGA
jgi:hypothetical protein